MPLPKDADPYATWWTLKSPDSPLHGVMFMRKQGNTNDVAPKPSQVADEHVLAGVLQSGTVSVLGQIFGANPQPAAKKRKLDELDAPRVTQAQLGEVKNDDSMHIEEVNK